MLIVNKTNVLALFHYNYEASQIHWVLQFNSCFFIFVEDQTCWLLNINNAWDMYTYQLV